MKLQKSRQFYCKGIDLQPAKETKKKPVIAAYPGLSFSLARGGFGFKRPDVIERDQKIRFELPRIG
jgi:hypothetical protein